MDKRQLQRLLLINHNQINKMKNKLSIWISGVISFTATFIGWFITLPPNQQGDVIAPIIAIVPVNWQAGIGVTLKAIGGISGLYATFKAAQSGPTTPTTQK